MNGKLVKKKLQLTSIILLHHKGHGSLKYTFSALPQSNRGPHWTSEYVLPILVLMRELIIN